MTREERARQFRLLLQAEPSLTRVDLARKVGVSRVLVTKVSARLPSNPVVAATLRFLSRGRREGAKQSGREPRPWLRRNPNQLLKERAKSIARFNDQLANLDARSDRTVQLRVDGELDAGEFDRAKAQIREERDRVSNSFSRRRRQSTCSFGRRAKTRLGSCAPALNRHSDADIRCHFRRSMDQQGDGTVRGRSRMAVIVASRW